MRTILIGTVLLLFFGLLSCGLLMSRMNNEQLSHQIARLRDRLHRVEQAYQQAEGDRLALKSKCRLEPILNANFTPVEVTNYERLDLVGPNPKVESVPMYPTSDGLRPKSLVAIAVGATGLTSGLVDAMVMAFGNGTGNFTVILFHYDLADYSMYPWYQYVAHIIVPRQMKWWYAKRFLTPQIVASYEFLFLWDEDLDVRNFNSQDYLEACRRYNLVLSTPAYDPVRTTKNSSWQVMVQKGSTFRKTNFVEVSAPVFRSDVWGCVWKTLQNDLASGWGYDLVWYNACHDLVGDHTGIVDSNVVAHISGDSASGSQNFKPRVRNENRVFRVRVPIARVRPGPLRHSQT